MNRTWKSLDPKLISLNVSIKNQLHIQRPNGSVLAIFSFSPRSALTTPWTEISSNWSTGHGREPASALKSAIVEQASPFHSWHTAGNRFPLEGPVHRVGSRIWKLGADGFRRSKIGCRSTPPDWTLFVLLPPFGTVQWIRILRYLDLIWLRGHWLFCVLRTKIAKRDKFKIFQILVFLALVLIIDHPYLAFILCN